jgi:tRNA-modifying protein YgfZ
MRVSPLLKLHQQAEASLVPYGPAEAGVPLVETFGELELEYGALRKGCVVIDQPHRGVIEVTGSERLDFLNRMVTQELKGIGPLQSRPSFWLNRKGRIDADLRVIELGDRTLLDMDIHAVPRTLAGLNAFIITEDVTLKDVSEDTHRLALHGPTSAAALSLGDPPPGHAARVPFAGADVLIERADLAGEVGLELHIPAHQTLDVYTRLTETQAKGAPRPAGWHAFNIARIEAGTPLYNIDFGPASLPHETGVIRSRVSFTKGCYLGQEVVARMESRGHSKGRIVGLRFAADEPRLPVAGAHIWSAAAPEGDPVGTITSSTPSPMLGAQPIAFAMLKHEFVAAGTAVMVDAEGERIAASVQEGLAFWKRG